MKIEKIQSLEAVIERTSRGVFSDDVPFAGYVPLPALIPDPAHKTCQLLFLSFVTAKSPETRQTAVFRPRGLLMLDARGKLVSYRNFRAAGDLFPGLSWSKPLALWPHKAVEDMEVADYMGLRRKLVDLYAAEMTGFPARRSLGKDFREAYRTVTHPIALPFLKELAPHFLAAVLQDAEA